MSTAQWLLAGAAVVWLGGVGVVAQGIAWAFQDDDDVPAGGWQIMPSAHGLMAAVLAVVVVAWPVAVPVMIFLTKRKKKNT